MESRARRTRGEYTLAFKLAVVGEVERGELTYSQAQTRYGIQGHSTVLSWLRKHGRQGWRTRASLAVMKTDDDMAGLTPEQQIKALRAQLEEAQQKAQLFEAVINVLKNDYGSPVVKKPSGKPSRKRSSRG